MVARAAIRSVRSPQLAGISPWQWSVTGEAARALAARPLQTHAVRGAAASIRVPSPTQGPALAGAMPAALARVALSGFYGCWRDMDQIVSALRTVQAEILASDGIEEAALASQVLELRTRVQTTSEGLEEAFAETRAQV
jgi:hypothetical protein